MMKKVYGVTQINRYIRNMFAQDFVLHQVCVKGEVSNCKYHSSGHIYFTLKENNSAISAIMFAGNRGGLSFRMKDGDKVEVTGSIEVFERDGRYQIYAKEITLAGAGDLYARFLQLKQELEDMGMFAEEYKKTDSAVCRTYWNCYSTYRSCNTGYPQYRRKKESLCAAYSISGTGTG